MSRSSFSILALTVLLAMTMAFTSEAAGQGKGKHKGKKFQIVHGCVTAVDTTGMTVTFQNEHTGVKVTVKVTKSTTIEINDVEGKTLTDLQNAVKSVPTGGQPYCGVARVNNLTSLTALAISVSNVEDD
jgi:hypothetical protein